MIGRHRLGTFASGLLVALCVLGAASRASAESIVLLSVPEGTPQRVVAALVVELQLSGHEPVVVRRTVQGAGVVPNPFAHSDAGRALVIERSGRVVVADRDGLIAETLLEERLERIHPRALAMIAADFVARRRPPPAAPPPDSPPPASTTPSRTIDLPRVRLLDPVDALSPPVVVGPSRALAAPRRPAAARAEASPAADPVVEVPRTPFPDWLRVLTEIAFGFAGSAVLGVPAAFATDAAGAPAYVGGWLYGFAAAGPVGYAIGAWLGGLVAGGTGNFWWTLLGGVAGGLVAGAFLLAGDAVDDDPTDGVDPGFTLIGAVALIAAPTTLSILGYELSASD